jgi:hypothetical protein
MRESLCRRKPLPDVGGQHPPDPRAVVGEDDAGGGCLGAQHIDGRDGRLGVLQLLDHRLQPQYLVGSQAARHPGAQGGFQFARLDLDARQRQLVEQTVVLVEQHARQQQ